MNKLNTILVCIIVLMLVIIPVSAQQLVWHEGFESYTTGSFPSTWTPDGNATDISTNYVTTTTFLGGAKSLRLHGRIAGCWAAIGYRPLTISPSFEVEVAVRNGNESLSGCHPDRAYIGIKQGFIWTNPGRYFILFRGNGNITSAAGNVLQTYTTLTWYTVRIRYERPSSSQVRISYWINGIYKGVETLTVLAQEDQMTNLDINAEEGTAWFDNISVYTVFLQYLSAKDVLITDILGIQRPFFGTSNPFYRNTEMNARAFVTTVRNDSLGGNADTLDTEGIARLVLSERVTRKALVDAIDISLYGAKGAKSIAFAWVVKGALFHLSSIVRAVPVIGGPAADFLEYLAARVENTIFHLNLAFQNGLVMPTGQLTLPQWNAAMDATREALSKGANRIVRSSAEAIDQGNFGGTVFDKAEGILQDFLFLVPLEFQTAGTQSDAVHRARTHLFPRNSFAQAATDATRTLNNMTASNQTAKDLGNFVNTIGELSGYVTLGAAFVLIIIGLIGAVPSGGFTLLAAIAGVATFLVTLGAQISLVSAVTEAAGATVYVNGILPHVYLNPSVDNAFGPSPIQEKAKQIIVLASSDVENILPGSANKTAMFDFYSRLREMIRTRDPQWATVGIDSLKYFENQYREDESITSAQFAAVGDTASKIINGYTALSNSYFTKIAARELFTASIEVSAFAYRFGLQTQSVLNTSLTAMDSTISAAQRIDTLSTILSAIINQYNVPVPLTVGIRKIETQVMSKTQRKVQVEAEIANYSRTSVSNVQPIVTATNAMVIGDSIKTVSLAGGEKLKVVFQVVSLDSVLAGAVSIRYSPTFYTLPGKAFLVNFEFQSPDNTGSVSEGHSYAYPNPFNPESEPAKFRYKLARDGNVTITVFDVRNTKVKEVITNVPMSAGVEQSIQWDGRNDRGNTVANGVYFYVIESSTGERAVGKVAVLR